jgi:hypothetical protein
MAASLCSPSQAEKLQARAARAPNKNAASLLYFRTESRFRWRCAEGALWALGNH